MRRVAIGTRRNEAELLTEVGNRQVRHAPRWIPLEVRRLPQHADRTSGDRLRDEAAPIDPRARDGDKHVAGFDSTAIRGKPGDGHTKRWQIDARIRAMTVRAYAHTSSRTSGIASRGRPSVI